MTEKEIRITAFMKRKLERLRTLPENQCRAELAELRHGNRTRPRGASRNLGCIPDRSSGGVLSE